MKEALDWTVRNAPPRNHDDDAPQTFWRRPVRTESVWRFTIWIVRLTLAVVLILAAASKLMNPEAIANTLKADHVPETFIPAATMAIAMLEILVAGVLVLAAGGARPLLLGAVIFTIFAAQLAYLKSQNILSCNCFSGLIQFESTGSALRFQMLVNILVAAVCAVLGFWNPGRSKGGSHVPSRIDNP